ncbi:phosphatase PAP2 family protein [Demequina lignilytica]|uniref:Phosphatase PAP2 family protein n=1 Tax=Demequina lignilytica TaxID=3051663 RepID=A0AB35MJ51_9MICO|nr:phosphatase PAP2 family protein [Demequina sp. SYSU T0a273]MDN4483830.1 phosphatase PAP2 family protein [Demequina sp. SYSU T0a273]
MARPRMRPSDAVTALWPGVLLLALGIGGFLVALDWVREQEDLFLLDQPLLEYLSQNRTPGLTAFFEVVTTIFGPVVLPIVVAVIALIWWRVSRSWWHPVLLVGAMILSTVLGMGLKIAVGRARPEDVFMLIPGFETSYSFPSGHTIGATTFVLVVSYLLLHEDSDATWRLALWSVGAVLIIALVALSRLYLGYHFLTDVLAGACVGVAVLGVVVAVERWRDLSLERVDPPQGLLSLAEVDDRPYAAPDAERADQERADEAVAGSEEGSAEEPDADDPASPAEPQDERPA